MSPQWFLIQNKKECMGGQFLTLCLYENVFLLLCWLGICFKVLNNFSLEFWGYCSVSWYPVQLLKNPVPLWSMPLWVWHCFSLWKNLKKLLLISFSSGILEFYNKSSYESVCNLLSDTSNVNIHILFFISLVIFFLPFCLFSLSRTWMQL